MANELSGLFFAHEQWCGKTCQIADYNRKQTLPWA